MQSIKAYLYSGAKYSLAALCFTVAVMLLQHIVGRFASKTAEKKQARQTFWVLWYISTLLLVVFDRNTLGLSQGAYNIYPLNALFDALSAKDRSAAVQIALNILVFVPMGIIVSAYCVGKMWHKICTAALLPLAIELVQLITGLGVFDVDDLLTNYFGELWGYWIGVAVAGIRKKKQCSSAAIAVATPLAAAIIALVCILARPYGFIRADFINASRIRPSTVEFETAAFELPERLYYYELTEHDRTEIEAAVDTIFNAVGLKRNMGFSDLYDNLSVYRAEKSNAYINFYKDGSFILYIPNGLESDAAEESISEILNGIFPDISGGKQLSMADAAFSTALTDGDSSWIGSLNWYEKDGKISRIESDIRKVKAYELCPCDMPELRQRLLKGRFQFLSLPDNSAGDIWLCSSIKTDTVEDSLGYLRPIYFLEIFNGSETFSVAVSATA